MNGFLVVAVMAILFSAPLWAAQLQVEVRVNVMRGCQLVGTTRDAGIEQLGVLDFGNTSRLDDRGEALGAALDAARLPRLECNPDTPYQVSIDGGLHGGTGDVRYLAGNGRSTPIPYRLYRDPARRIALPVNQPVSGIVPDTGSVTLPLYARIEPFKQIPQVSQYSDVVKVTVSW
ncbi:spore coat U domain-containing protein [Pseudomonas sp. NPDC090202]|uniref:Csu type fimbrial protein n=1 Tax=unclassified Pseudomonas TaxID=196821 RepID=UPI0037FF98BD